MMSRIAAQAIVFLALRVGEHIGHLEMGPKVRCP
jgi:hypothetical protein